MHGKLTLGELREIMVTHWNSPEAGTHKLIEGITCDSANIKDTFLNFLL